MPEDVVYSDKKSNSALLGYIASHGKLQPDMVMTVGVVKEVKTGDSVDMKLSMFSDNPYKDGEAIFQYAHFLMAQKRRKVADIIKTFDYILGSAEEISLQLGLCNHPYAGKFEGMIHELYNFRMPMEKAVQVNPDVILEDAVKDLPMISDMVEFEYRKSYSQYNQYAKNMLDESPEFKNLVDEKLLTNLLVNTPIVTPEQASSSDYPSDLVSEKVE
jgi:hypothetical protein